MLAFLAFCATLLLSFLAWLVLSALLIGKITKHSQVALALTLVSLIIYLYFAEIVIQHSHW